MKIKLGKSGWYLIFIFLFLGILEARAEVQLTDSISVTGFLRHELAIHTASQNPNNITQEDNNSINLSRTFFQTEWNYQPTDIFKLFAKIRIISDQTESLDSDLEDYNAFPLSTPRYGTYLRATDDDDWTAEMWELYADLDIGNLWVRLGKQQIVWGEMISARIMDIANPLDWSWHFQFEPEEFENIRVPQWAIRAMYNIEQTSVSWLHDLYLEGYVNPGDISPRIWPEYGSPFNLKPPTLPIFQVDEIDRRGDTEYGIRIGGRVGQFFATLNYLHLYTKTGAWENVSLPGPPPFSIENRYPEIDVYGATVNYAFDSPINATVTYEGTYIPKQPYQDALSVMPVIKDRGTVKHAIRFQRKTRVFSRHLLSSPIPQMNIQFQLSQTIVEGDPDDIKSTPAPYGRKTNKIDKTQNVIALILNQDLWYNQISLSFKAIYDLKDSHYIVPGFKYRHGDDWYFDIYGVVLGGSEKRSGRFGSMDWGDEVFARITYQF